MGGQVKASTTEKSEHCSSLDPKQLDVKKYRELQDKVERRQSLRHVEWGDVSPFFGATS
jgi:hypothetical protein